MKLTHCPRCQQKVVAGERFCWWCSVDLERYTGLCTECGQPKDLCQRVVKYVREAERA